MKTDLLERESEASDGYGGDEEDEEDDSQSHDRRKKRKEKKGPSSVEIGGVKKKENKFGWW